jgi:hypothetical protein
VGQWVPPLLVLLLVVVLLMLMLLGLLVMLVQLQLCRRTRTGVVHCCCVPPAPPPPALQIHSRSRGTQPRRKRRFVSANLCGLGSRSSRRLSKSRRQALMRHKLHRPSLHQRQHKHQHKHKHK